MPLASQIFVSALVPAPCPEQITHPDQIDLWNTFEKAKVTAIHKNQAYGSSVFTPGVLTPDVSVDAAIRTRLSDKISRILNLTRGCVNSVPSESLLDTWMDAGVYCFLECIWLHRQQEAYEAQPQLLKGSSFSVKRGPEMLKAAKQIVSRKSERA